MNHLFYRNPKSEIRSTKKTRNSKGGNGANVANISGRASSCLEFRIWNFEFRIFLLVVLLLTTIEPLPASTTNHYIHLEADEFRDIQLNLQVAVGYPDPVDKHTNWCSRMAIFPDTTQGGPTRILSLDAHAQQTKNSCWRDIDVPAGGKYRVWVRYSDWRNKTEFFKVKVEQGGKVKIDAEFGGKPVLSDSDEMKLRVEFAYAWDGAECALERGPAHITLYTDRVADADRDVDVLILTDDLDYIPRERGVLTPAYGAYIDRWMKDRQPLKPIMPPSTNFAVPDAWKI